MDGRGYTDDGEIPPPPPDDSDLPPPPPDDFDLPQPPPPPDRPPDESDGDSWTPGPPPRSPEEEDGEAWWRHEQDAVPPPPEDEGEFEGDSYGLEGSQMAYPQLSEVVELQLTADERVGFGLGMDPFLTIDTITGPAKRDGWQLGWTILAVQGQPVSDHSQLIQQLARAGKTARFTVQIPRLDGAHGEDQRQRDAVVELERQKETAATAIQTRFRGNQARLRSDQQRAARLIQSRYRGNRSRTQLSAAREREAVRAKAWEAYHRGPSKAPAPVSASRPARSTNFMTSEQLLKERAAAATKVQASFRGKQARRNLKLERPPPGYERKLRLSRDRELLRANAPMHQSYLQQLQAAANELSAELKESGIEAAKVLQQPPSGASSLSTGSLEQAAQRIIISSTQQTTVWDKSHARSPKTLNAQAMGLDQARYWREAWDSQYNCPYYWHKKTKEVRWEMPEGFSRSRRQSSRTSVGRSKPLQMSPASSYSGVASTADQSRRSKSGLELF
eukprot:COSAG02_NODE_1819_length_10773_cov_6.699550_3_plen_504_part_00